VSDASVLEKLQQASGQAEIWWDSSPAMFPAWCEGQLRQAPDAQARRRWSAQLERFLVLEDPARSLVRGITTNPALIAKTILAAPELWARRVRDLIRLESDPRAENLCWLIYLEAVRQAAQMILPMWHHTEGRYGWVSGQLDPRDMFDTPRMMQQAVQLAALAPNLMVKVPGTRQGYEVIRALAARGISVNNTLSYGVPQFAACINAVEDGLAEARCRGVDLGRWRCVITYMIGRFGSQGDLLDEAQARGLTLTPAEIRWAEVAVIKRIQRIIVQQAAPVKMLLSSLQVDNRAAGCATLSMHLEETAGADIAYTCKPEFIGELMRREGELESFDPTSMQGEVPAPVLQRLMQLPYFRRALEADGTPPEDFAKHGAFLTTYTEFNRWARRLIDFTDRQLHAAVVARL
jgi:transaldolase